MEWFGWLTKGMLNVSMLDIFILIGEISALIIASLVVEKIWFTIKRLKG